MRAWDTKLTHQLTEHEMAAYVNDLTARQVLDEQEQITKAVAYIVEAWQRDRNDLCAQPMHAWHYRIVRSRSVAPIDVFYATFDPVSDISVYLPQWVDPNMAEYLAREQILEQWDAQ